MSVNCYQCALRRWGVFKPVTPEELHTINDILRERISLPADADIVRAGDESPELYTLYSGWAFRFKTLPDGRRQILNFLLPGDLVSTALLFEPRSHVWSRRLPTSCIAPSSAPT